MMNHNPTGSLRSEFFALVQGAKTYLTLRKETGALDIGLSEESMAMVRSWEAKKKTPQAPKQEGFTPGLRGEGDPQANLFIVTEQKKRGTSPYDGADGELFLNILKAIGLSRETVYISSVPASGPIAGAVERIKRELKLVKPMVVCTLGRRASQTLLDQKIPLPDLRGRFHDFNGIPVMPTFHPSSLIEDVAKKRPVWEDMKMIKARMGG
ncbi:MAG: uracil-DNA glycosylase [Desulfobacterium sp.]|nr:uracil-DNA glycosylase [Desulfobacterium sp.]